MKFHVVAVLLFFMFLLVGVGSTFFTIKFLWLLYKIVELMCYLNGEECKESLRKKYEPLGTNPKAYAIAHPVEIIIGRIMGIFFLMLLIFVLISVFP